MAEYQIKQIANGSSSANLTVSLTGQLAAKEYYLVGHLALKKLSRRYGATAGELSFQWWRRHFGCFIIMALRLTALVHWAKEPVLDGQVLQQRIVLNALYLNNHVSSAGIEVTAPFDLASASGKIS